MAHHTLDLVLDLDASLQPDAIRAAAAAALGVNAQHVTEVRPRKRSIDARRRPVVRLRVEVWADEPAPDEPPPSPPRHDVTGRPQVIVVGCGPAGMFAALRLIEQGLRPIVLERGKDVQARRHDLAAITRRGEVNPDSNYCFGEGGAGTYSDGKLYTRATRRGSVEDVLRTLVAHGAPADILVDAHPHIGSNRLPRVVAAMRETIRASGGEVRFETRVTGLVRGAGGRVVGVRTADGAEHRGEAVILATGHSARDVFEMLMTEGIPIEAKPFAMGVRVEHPQPLIDRVQYHIAFPDVIPKIVSASTNPPSHTTPAAHTPTAPLITSPNTPSPNAPPTSTAPTGGSKAWRHPALPAASYRLAHTVDGRGVFSFCMCPGGWIVPAATAPGEVVVNGMSLSRRDSPFANSGMVVAIELEDLAPYASHGPLAGVAYQHALEKMAAEAGGGHQRSPAQRITDFVNRRESTTLPPSSYHPGLTAAPLHALLPPAIGDRLRAALTHFGKTVRGYMTDDAVVVGVESRTSSPVRIPRDGETLEHPTTPGLYPCGEGAGYAGGIVSAAIDGTRVADAIAARVGAR